MTRHSHKSRILEVAVNLARTKPYHQLTKLDVAKAAACSGGLVIHHFESMDKLYDAIVECAIAYKVLRIVGDAIAQRHERALAAPRELRQAAISALLT